MSKDIVLHQPDSDEHEVRGNEYVAQARLATIEDAHDLALAASVMADLSKAVKAIKIEFDGTPEDPGPTALAYKTWKAMVAIRDKALKGFEEAYDEWNRKKKKFEYDTEQKRIAEAQAAEREANRIAQEERDRAIQAAKKAKDTQLAKSLEKAPLNVTPVAPTTPEVPKVDGMRRSSADWGYTITNVELLPRVYLMPDESAIKVVVKKLGLKAQIPGVSVYDRRSVG